METINSRKVLSLVKSYQEYPVPRIFGDDHYYTFMHGSLYGLFNLSDEKVINLLAINNSKMHNGQFIKFVELLEQFARDNNLKFMIGELFNPRLDNWFARRGYKKDRDNRIYVDDINVSNILSSGHQCPNQK